MKKINVILFLILLVLSSCSGSDSYQGKWKAIDAKAQKLEINFEAKNFTVKDHKGNLSKYSYTQNSYKYENSITIYGIQLSDGRAYEIHFPKNNDENVALLKEQSGNLIYIMGRKKFLTYDDVYKLD